MRPRDVPKSQPVPPDAPPLPSEVDQEGPEPMAVANDKANLHGESFVPTTASQDAYAPAVARRYRQVPEANAAREPDEEPGEGD